MSNEVPPWFIVNEGLNNMAPNESVLPAGKQTCPLCITEADGGDPSDWWVSASHAQLITLNEDNDVTITIEGSFIVEWERIQISESGFAGSCAKRITTTTGKNGEVPFEFIHEGTIEKRPCLPISDTPGSLVQQIAGITVPGPDDTASVDITNNAVGVAICGSTGCSSGDLGNYNSDTTASLTASNAGAVALAEQFCRSGVNSYKYRMEGFAGVEFSDGGYVLAYFYTGVWDWDRFGGEPPEASLPDWTLSAEEDVGTIRGITVHSRSLNYEHDHADSTIVGIPNDCPSPSYSSDVTTGTTTGTITVVIDG